MRVLLSIMATSPYKSDGGTEILGFASHFGVFAPPPQSMGLALGSRNFQIPPPMQALLTVVDTTIM